MRVAFQGIHGAYSEVAARQYFGNSCSTLPCESFDDVFSAVDRKRADRGIIPIENSLAGSIHQNYDLLLSHTLHIVGEIHVRIDHVLMSHRDTTLRRITHVRSHPQALAQCHAFLRAIGVAPVPYFDTAGAARSIVEERLQETGAIAGEHAAKLFGLKVLKRNIGNEKHNFTRFLILGRTPWKGSTRKNKSSLVFAPSTNRTGILFEILGVFYVRNVDLLKIESRPDPRSPFEYLFYLDIAGSPKEQRVARALEHLQEKTHFCRLLGSYPMGKGNFYGAAGL